MISEKSLTSDKVYYALRKKIISGGLMPGDRLVQTRLAEEFGTSNIPVLEAVRRLEHDGLVEVRAGLGARVKIWNPDDMIGSVLAREVLEGAACRRFVVTSTQEEKDTLIRLAKEFDERGLAQDKIGCIESDMVLHQHIVKCTRSNEFARIAESSRVITYTLRNLYWAGDPFGPPGVHDELVEALLSGDPVRAEETGRAHIRTIGRVLWNREI